jgi:hypothetical protein
LEGLEMRTSIVPLGPSTVRISASDALATQGKMQTQTDWPWNVVDLLDIWD